MIVATISLKVGQDAQKELLQTFEGLFGPMLTDQGCLGYRVYREIGNDEVVMLVEQWETKRAWENHLQSKAFTVLLGAIGLSKDASTVEFQLLTQTTGLNSLKTIREEA